VTVSEDQAQQENGAEAVEGGVQLKGMSVAELEAAAVSLGLKPYRGRQLARWIYGRGETAFAEMTDLSKDVRRELETAARISQLHRVREVRSPDDETVKYLFELGNGMRVESVLMREGSRRTLCVSSQVGCALDCTFCATGRMGFRYNLTAGEIVDQLITVRRIHADQERPVTHVVLMGMGEPFLNYDAVLKAIRLMNLELGPGLGLRRITVSTAGHVPGILQLGEEGLQVGLAVSLNASTDQQREAIMPINRKWPIPELLAAVREYLKGGNRRVTFEYVMLHGFNDAEEDARRLVRLLGSIRCKVNLIPWNPVPSDSIDGQDFHRPEKSDIDRFADILRDGLLTATVRYSKGTDIAAGCGQLFDEVARESDQNA
jgi:23S rRNA (adenine2503-C2)-methyltransferase